MVKNKKKTQERKNDGRLFKFERMFSALNIDCDSVYTIQLVKNSRPAPHAKATYTEEEDELKKK